MKKVLEKIAWKTRRWNYKFQLLNLYLHDGDESWGFDFFTINKDYMVYSLLRFEFRLPNKTSVKKFTIDDWDILFLSRFLLNKMEDLEERRMWSPYTFTKWEIVQLRFLNKIFK